MSGSEYGRYLIGVVGGAVSGGNELGHVVDQHELETLEPLLEGIPSVWCAHEAGVVVMPGIEGRELCQVRTKRS